MLNVASASASSYQSGCPANNTIDGYADMDHRWNAYDNNYPEWLKLDPGSTQSIERVKTAFREPSTRLYNYNIQVSTDDSNYTTVVSKQAVFEPDMDG